MSKKLTPKQELFVERYLISLNATQAAKDAGYSEKTAYSQGQRLLKNVEIQAALGKNRGEIKQRNELSQDWIVQKLMAIGGFSLKQVATVSESGDVKLNAEADEMAYTGVNISQSSSSGETSSESLSISSKNQVRALELLGKHIGMWGDGTKDTDGRESAGVIDSSVQGYLEEDAS